MEQPSCLGKFLAINNRDCGSCSYRIDCYELFRKREKEVEQLRKDVNVPWFKKSACEWIEKLGYCESCS